MKYKKYIVFDWSSYCFNLNDSIVSSHDDFDAAMNAASHYNKHQIIDRDTWEEAKEPVESQDHNPDNLTPEQVGVSDGWRLLSKEENSISYRMQAKITIDIQRWSSSELAWDDSSWSGDEELFTYRTRKPAGYYLK